MIPRRRIPIAGRDLRDIIAAPFVPRVQDAADVAAFEAAFGASAGCGHAVATASGRDALLLILDALRPGPGAEIVVPAYTLGELLPLIAAQGLRCVAADIDATTLNVTAASVAARITPQTGAILVDHLFGAPCDIAALASLAARHGLPLIEDCAHAAGAVADGKPVGSFGQAALFSLEVGKGVPTFGGGMLTTSDARIAEHARTAVARHHRLRGPAMRKAALKCVEELAVRSPLYALAARLMFGGSGGGFERAYRRAHDRLRPPALAYSGLQARIGLRRLATLDARNRRLNTLWEELAQALPPGFTPLRRDRHGRPAFYNFAARYDGDIVRLRRAAQNHGLDLAIGSEVMDDCAALLGQTDCPVAAAAFAAMVQVPLHDGLGCDGPRRVAEKLAAAARQCR